MRIPASVAKSVPAAMAPRVPRSASRMGCSKDFGCPHPAVINTTNSIAVRFIDCLYCRQSGCRVQRPGGPRAIIECIREGKRRRTAARAEGRGGADAVLSALLHAPDLAEMQAALRAVRLLHELRGLLLNDGRTLNLTGTLPAGAGTAGGSAHRRFWRRRRLHDRAGQMEDPPDHRASGRRGNRVRAPD